MTETVVDTTPGFSGLRITAVVTALVGLAVPGGHVIAYALPRRPG